MTDAEFRQLVEMVRQIDRRLIVLETELGYIKQAVAGNGQAARDRTQWMLIGLGAIVAIVLLFIVRFAMGA